VWRAFSLIIMATVLEKILENNKEPQPIPKPETWTLIKDQAFRRCLGKVKCKGKIVGGKLAVKPENMILFQRSFDGTPLEHSAIAAELAKHLHQDNVWIWFKR
jgi:hypothetical protein